MKNSQPPHTRSFPKRNSTILYVSRAGIPNEAPSIRMYNIAKILRTVGYKIDFMCNRINNLSGDTEVTFDEFTYYYNEIRPISILYELLFPRRIFNKIKKYCEEKKPYAIILYNDMYPLTKKLIWYTKQNNIKLVADVTEWYDSKFNAQRKAIPYLVNKRIIKLDARVHNIISVSPYLHNYYTTLGCNSIFIPPVFAVPKKIKITKHNYYSYNVLNLVYAGFPGLKDIITPILHAIKEINRDVVKVRLDVVGPDISFIKDKCGDSNLKKIAIIPHGRLSHSDTLKIVKQADFGILLRRNRRYAKAGFSTKFSECMSCGVPMICNRVGGIDTLIDSMKDGIIIEDYNVKTIVAALKNLIALKEADIIRLKEHAHKKALNIFNRDSYIDPLNKYFLQIK